MSNNPIGIFDSGLGGLSVWRVIRAMLPEESLLYFADGARCPYGEKSAEQVRQYTAEAVELMLERGAKMIVLACNTATAAAVEYLRERYPAIPIVGMEPAVKPAILSTESGVVGILATKGSLEGDMFNRTAAKYGTGVRVLTAVGEGFVGIVESGQEDSPEACEQVRRMIEPLIEGGADRIVLGCTHYPFLAGRMREVIGGRGVELIDPSAAVARRVAQLLEEYDIAAEAGHEAEYSFGSFGDEEYLARLERKAAQALDMDFS